ncbi:hypothetical protein Esi_0523_0010 [Ectocarpus siliculosus]|uniref:Uncharacterized protein n=1 Tax=Ectocarpus siliculosus TaxID=2880 RepID=D7G3R8_ECTSI|nr:hypothetical protein Esi_0523_0010 [Ectocarpus siliculosus]|eukprot:CBJ33595.1 hypothetical protein Esi_0523_0010 [Ectocarpus siliculosus]
MGHPKNTPRKRGSQDDWTTPLGNYAFDSPVKPRNASTRRPPFSPTSPNTGRTPPRARSTKRLQLVDNDGDDSVWSLPEEESEGEQVPAAKGVSSKKPKCGGGNPWAKKLKKDIIVDTDEKLTLVELVTDLVSGVAESCDRRKMSQELNELVAEYEQSKANRPVEGRSLFALIGKKGAQTTEQRLSVANMKGKPELRRFILDIEESVSSTGLVLIDNTTKSRKGTEANNAMVIDPRSGEWVKATRLKGKAGGPKSNFGKTKGETVAGAKAREAAASATFDAAMTDEEAAEAKQKLDNATKRHRVTEPARADQAKGGAASSGTDCNQGWRRTQ